MDFGPLGAGRSRALAASGHGRAGAGLRRNDPVRAGPLASSPGALRRGGRDRGRLQRNRADRKGARRPYGEEARTLRLCWTLTARFAGDLALAFLAKGGVTFSGGILPRILDFLRPGKIPRGVREQAALWRSDARHRHAARSSPRTRFSPAWPRSRRRRKITPSIMRVAPGGDASRSPFHAPICSREMGNG